MHPRCMAAAHLRQFLARGPDSLLLLLQGPYHRRSRLRTRGSRQLATYSTKDVHPRDSMSYWLEIVGAGFVKLAVKTTGAFNGTVTVGSIGSLVASTYDCDAHGVSRGGQEISRADNDDYFICLQQTGRSIHIQGDREALNEDGTFFLLDPRRPFWGEMQTAGRIVTIRVPRQELEARTALQAR